jgi:hypothetical protein
MRGYRNPTTTLIDLSPERPEVVFGEIETMHDAPPDCHGEVDLYSAVKHRRPGKGAASVNERTAQVPVELLPETRPLEEYKFPLTHEIIEENYLDLISAQTDRKLFDVVPDSVEYETVRRQAKKEITQKMLWKMGMASEAILLLDIDNEETRELLTEEFRKIPPDVDRDNNPNSFKRRKDLIEAHILETSTDPDIETRLADIREVWLGDLALRAEIMHDREEPPQQDRLREEREEYLDDLLSGSASSNEITDKIGNTLLHATPEAKRYFYKRVCSIVATTPQADKARRHLIAYIEEYHLPNS